MPLREEFDYLQEIVEVVRSWEADGEWFHELRFPVSQARVVAVILGEMGLPNSALRAERLIARFRIGRMFVLGIAGGVSDDVLLGDVVVARQVSHYLHGAKAVAREAEAGVGHESHDYIPAGWDLNLNSDLIELAMNVEFIAETREHFREWQAENSQRRDEIAVAVQNLQLSREVPIHLIGPMASGDVVGAASSFVAFLRERNRKLLAVEMEAFGAALATQSRTGNESVQLAVVRGISDFADERKNQIEQEDERTWRRYAMQSASGFLDVLLSGLAQSDIKDDRRFSTGAHLERRLEGNSLMSLARHFSTLGEYEEAIAAALTALEREGSEAVGYKVASMEQFVAVQYRHMARFRESAIALARAEERLLAGNESTPTSRLLGFRIKFGRIMTEDYLIGGQPNEALARYEGLMDRVRIYIDEAGLADEELIRFQRYELHGMRQIAEMYRMLGEYEEARRLFAHCFEAYGLFGEERAYSQLGVSDSLRMKGEFTEAKGIYQELIEYAANQENLRLHARALRNRIECDRTLLLTGSQLDPEQIQTDIERLFQISERAGYHFGLLYGRLSAACHLLQADPGAAAVAFTDARELTDAGSGDRIRLEWVHTILGEADALRLKREYDEAVEKYREALDWYRKGGIKWGESRAYAGLRMADNPGKDEVIEYASGDQVLDGLLSRDSSLSIPLVFNLP